jgi:hypothetical protein
MNASGGGKPGGFSDRLRECIADKGVSLEQARRDLRQRGMTRSNLSHWLGGRAQNPRVETAVPAAEYFGVSVLWLATGHGPKRPPAATAKPAPPGISPDLIRLTNGGEPAPAGIVPPMMATVEGGALLYVRGIGVVELTSDALKAAIAFMRLPHGRRAAYLRALEAEAKQASEATDDPTPPQAPGKHGGGANVTHFPRDRRRRK